MQTPFLTARILETSLFGATNQEANELINTIICQNYALPRPVEDLRPSYRNFRETMLWGGNEINAHIASLSAMNGDHACFSKTYDLIAMWFNCIADGLFERHLNRIIASREKIPGFGNPVFKGNDDRCDEIKAALYRLFHKNQSVIDSCENLINSVRGTLAEAGKGDIYPNLVFWNCLSIYLLGLPRQFASILFIMATQVRYLNQTIEIKR